MNCNENGNSCKLEDGKPALITTEWCGASKMAHAELAKNNADPSTYLNYDYDKTTSLPEDIKSEIKAFPAVVMCEKGKNPSKDTCKIDYGVGVAVSQITKK